MGGLYIVAKVWTAKDETRFYGGTNMTSDSTFSPLEASQRLEGVGGGGVEQYWRVWKRGLTPRVGAWAQEWWNEQAICN